jgi:nicotinamidase-related amidase
LSQLQKLNVLAGKPGWRASAHDGYTRGAARIACIESTGRVAMELGYHVTLVRDATAAYSKEMMHAAHDLNGPSFAHAILKTRELIAALQPA